MDLAERRALIGQVLTDRPRVHTRDPILGWEPPGGVWGTDRSVYEWLAERCGPGTRTLETGLGISTALFAGWGGVHTCIYPIAAEGERLRDYLVSRDIDTSRLELVCCPSDRFLPTFEPAAPFDGLLIDGGHGFPLPVIDWFYGTQHLRPGGFVVLDDVHLPAVRLLLRYVRTDPRFRRLHRHPRWHAYELVAEMPSREEWTEQPHFAERAGRQELLTTARSAVRGQAVRARDALRQVFRR